MGDHQTYETAGSGNGTAVPQGQTLAKAPTHIQGLDEILEGGLPRGRTSVVSGGPGSGSNPLWRSVFPDW